MSGKVESELLEHLCGSRADEVGSHALATVTLEKCHSCQLSLPWPLPVVGQWASPVACPRCHRWYFTQTRNHATPELVIQFEPVPAKAVVQKSDKAPHTIPTKVAYIIAKLFGDCFVHEERRNSVRYAMSLPIVAAPLNENGLPEAEAFQLTILNLSAGGCLLLADQYVEYPLLMLDFSSANCVGIQLLARIVRQETSGVGTKLGCEFLHDSDEGLPFKV